MAIWIICSGLVLLVVCLTFILRKMYVRLLALEILCGSAFLEASKAQNALGSVSSLLKEKCEVLEARSRAESERTTYLEKDLGDFQASVYEAIKLMTDKISGGSLKSKSVTSMSAKKNDKKPD